MQIIFLIVLGLAVTTGCGNKNQKIADDPGLHAGGPPELRSIDQLKPDQTEQQIPESVRYAGVESIETAPPPAAVTPPNHAEPQFQTHTFVRGDTLWSLATKYLGDGKRWSEIVPLNPGLEPNKLTPGKTIKIPAK